jgi:DNA-3-methyladenine glycosylase
MENMIKRKFYNRNTLKVAQDLLGCFLVREYRGKIIRAKIIETEAYRGEWDLASHASKGKTERTKIMYGNPGHAYIYLVYGMYFMFNVVTEKKDFPAAVLIRGVESSIEASTEASIFNGPGKLTKFLHIDKSLNGHDLTLGKKLWLEPPAQKISTKYIVAGKRIGVDYAKHCKEWKWNFKIN